MTDIEDLPQKTGLEGNIKLLPSQNLQSYNTDFEDLNRLSVTSDEVKRAGTLDEPIKETIVNNFFYQLMEMFIYLSKVFLWFSFCLLFP